MREKIRKLQKAGIATLGRRELAALIEAKIDASYIYNMVFLEQHNVVKFNLIVEGRKARQRLSDAPSCRTGISAK